MTRGSRTMKGTRIRLWLLTGGFILVALVWVMHAILVWCDATILGIAVSSVPFWKVAEVSSIIVTLIVSVVFWITYFVGDSEHTAILKGTDDPLDTLKLLGWLGLFFVGFAGAAVVAGFAQFFAWLAWLGNYDIIVQVLCLVTGAIAAVMLGDKALQTTYKSLEKCDEMKELDKNSAVDQEDKAHEVLDKIDARDNISKFLCFSDIPIAFAMIVVLILIVCWVFISQNAAQNAAQMLQMRAFVAGAVALQLLYSNCVYWIEAFADTQKGRKILSNLWPSLQTIKRMLLPEECPDGISIVDWAKRKLDEELQ